MGEIEFKPRYSRVSCWSSREVYNFFMKTTRSQQQLLSLAFVLSDDSESYDNRTYVYYNETKYEVCIGRG